MRFLIGLFVALLATKLFNTIHPNLIVKYCVTPCEIFTLVLIGAIYKIPVTTFAVLITVGLLMSVVSDSLMMIEGKDLFLPAMATFSIVHILYIIAFAGAIPKTPSFPVYFISLFVIVASIIIYSIVVPGVPSVIMKVGLGVYLLLESCMVVLSIWQVQDGITSLAMIGGIMFWISDIVIGWNMFKSPILYSSTWVWSLYGIGQFLIAMSMMNR